MSEDQVYVRFKGKVLGPLTLHKIQELARRGQVTRMHDLSADGITWVKAEEFGDVFSRGRNADSNTPREGVSAALGSGNSTQASSNAPLNRSTQSTPVNGTDAYNMEPLRRPSESPDQAIQWYAHLNGSNQGPLSSKSLESAVKSGQIIRDTLIWRAGFDDWKPAAQGFPELFKQIVDAPPGTIGGGAPVLLPTIAAIHPYGAHNLYTELHLHRPWALWLGAVFMTIGFMGALFWVVYMVVGAETTFGVPTAGSRKVITGLTGLTGSGLIICTGFLLGRYASALKGIAFRQEESVALEAIRRLRTAMKFVGLVFLILAVVILSGLIISFVMAAGAGAGVI
ncbi:MAG TPA: hypothetical protein DDZ51_14920 [Planctomycetaceae bacterium]|nr:hypothetical protein [Planctomycetaceae bacterium]